METSDTNSSDSNSETAAAKDSLQPTTSSSAKRCRMDPSIPSTSNQAANTSHVTEEEKRVDEDTSTQDSEEDDNKKLPLSRFAKRNYRKPSDSSASSTSSESMQESVPQPNNADADANETEPIENNRIDTPDPLIPDDAIISLFDDNSSDSDDSIVDDASSASDTGNSTENEQKAQIVVNKPQPKCDLNLVRNLVYRQSGIIYKGERRTYDALANGLMQRINSSLYSVERMKLLHKLDEHTGCVNCLNFNKAGNLLVTGSDDLHVIVWNWAKRKPILRQSSGHRSNVFQSKFVDNGSANNQTDFNLVTSARDGEVRHIKIAPSGACQARVIARHTNFPVHKIAIPDSNPSEVLTAGEDGCVMRSDLRDAKPAEKLIQVISHRDEIPLYSIAVHPYDPEFCVCGRDKFVRVYDKRNVKECTKMFCPDNILKQTKDTNYINITCALYNYSGTEILASYGDENIYLFDTSNNTPGTYKKSYNGHKNGQTIKGVNFFGPCSEFVMSGSDCGNFFMWDKNSEAIVQWLPGDENGVVNCLEGHPNFPIIATSGLDHDIKIWSPMNSDEKFSKEDLKKCIKENLSHQSDTFVRTYMRSIARLVNGGFHRPHRSSSEDDTSDSDDDDDDDPQSFYRPDRGPCEVQ